MKQILILFATLLIVPGMYAQTSQTLVSGKVADNKKTPVEAATVSLLKAADSSLQKISVTDKDGKFVFQNIPFGSYYVTVSAVNYSMVNSAVFQNSNTSSTKIIDSLVLQQQIKSLAAVTATAKKPTVKLYIPEKLTIRFRGKLTRDSTGERK